MYDCTRNYINGEWIESRGGSIHDVVNPSTEEVIGKVSFGTAEDVDRAVAAAQAAFESFSLWSVDQGLFEGAVARHSTQGTELLPC